MDTKLRSKLLQLLTVMGVPPDAHGSVLRRVEANMENGTETSVIDMNDLSGISFESGAVPQMTDEDDNPGDTLLEDMDMLDTLLHLRGGLQISEDYVESDPRLKKGMSMLQQKLHTLQLVLMSAMLDGIDDFIAYRQLLQHRKKNCVIDRNVDEWRADVAEGKTSLGFDDWQSMLASAVPFDNENGDDDETHT